MSKDWLAAMGLGVALSLSCAPSSAAGNEPQQASMTVLAMLKVESDVLARWRDQKSKVSSPTPPKPSLISIYGVLPQLRASVMVNGREVVFEQGRKHPVHPRTSALSLRQIKPPCVSFAQGGELQTVCLRRVGL